MFFTLAILILFVIQIFFILSFFLTAATLHPEYCELAAAGTQFFHQYQLHYLQTQLGVHKFRCSQQTVQVFNVMSVSILS